MGVTPKVLGRRKVPVLDFTCHTHQQVQGSKRCGAGSLDNNLGTSLSVRKIHLRITIILHKSLESSRASLCNTICKTPNMEVKWYSDLLVKCIMANIMGTQ